MPIISTASLYRNVLEEAKKKIAEGKVSWEIDESLYIWQFERDLLASDIYTFLYPNKFQRKAGMDFEYKVIEMLG